MSGTTASPGCVVPSSQPQSSTAPRVGRLHAPAEAFDELDADLALQRGKVLGDGGRRDPQGVDDGRDTARRVSSYSTRRRGALSGTRSIRMRS
jgi:hypothetical protein